MCIRDSSNLNQRFGRGIRSKKRGIKYVLDDVESFAKNTSLTLSSKVRRSILFVPAMTPRSVDYAVLGQANYLASGLTTVFCNDSGKYGHGQSCFIGHGGWDNERGGSSEGVPAPGPYHGALPGIYRPFESDRGWLGTNEQALVIADVDPTYQSEGKPRPQNLLPPLSLVAHLPVLEVGDCRRSKDGAKKGNYVTLAPPQAGLLDLQWPQEEFWRSRTAVDFASRKSVVDTILIQLSKHLTSEGNSNSTLGDQRANQIANALRALAFAVPENFGWLKKRAECYATESMANPQKFSPPTALDWLYVDLQEPAEYPTIQVPPYAKEP